MTGFSDAIKEALRNKGMNYSQLAQKMDYSVQYISDLLAGKKRWNETTITKACEVLELEFQVQARKEVFAC
jgi:ribosome-binding protein aMBF1 (putative translation factor)